MSRYPVGLALLAALPLPWQLDPANRWRLLGAVGAGGILGPVPPTGSWPVG